MRKNFKKTELKEIFRKLFRIIRNSQSEVRTCINREPWCLVLVASKIKYIEIKKPKQLAPTNQPIKIMFGQTRNVVCGKLLELRNWWIFHFEALLKDPVICHAIRHYSFNYLMCHWHRNNLKMELWRCVLSHRKLMI